MDFKRGSLAVADAVSSGTSLVRSVSRRCAMKGRKGVEARGARAG